MNSKICPMCKKKVIEGWESTCWWCWQYAKWHDIEFGTNWCKNLIALNHIREECRISGFDPFERIPF